MGITRELRRGQRQGGFPEAAFALAALFLLANEALPAQAMRPKAPTTVWQDMSGCKSVPKAELDFVHRLDLAWSKGSAKAVYRMFRFKHPQMAMDLAARVLSTSGGRPCKRTSRILAGSRHAAFRSLYLSVTLAIEQAPGRYGQTVRLFEILVFAEADTKEAKGTAPKAMLLLETSPELQSHVSAALEPGGPTVPGLPLGFRPGFACPACNYEVRAPASGNWLVVAKPRPLSGNLEAIEIVSLDADFSMELTIVPIRQRKLDAEHKKASIRHLVKATATGLLGLSAQKSQAQKLTLRRISENLIAYGTRVELTCRAGTKRDVSLYGFRRGALNYILSFQGASSAHKSNAERVTSLLHSFKFIKPDLSESEGLAILNKMHGGGGRFEGSTFLVERLGLSLAGPCGWQTRLQTGVSEFCGEWLAKDTGSFLRVRGIERSCSATWTDAAMTEWARRWFIMNLRSVAHLHERSKLKRCMFTSRTGELRGVQIDYEFTPRTRQLDKTGSKEKSLGHLVLIPKGKLLIVVNAVANPGKEQEKTLARLTKQIACIELN